MPQNTANLREKNRVCFLVYSHLTKLAEQVIKEIPQSDIEYILMETTLETHDECIAQALELGCEVFIAGGGNFARFLNNYNLPIVQIENREIDYAMAIRTAIQKGGKKIAVARHRLAKSIDITLLESILEVPLQELVFESHVEMYEQAEKTDCDAIVGASLACDAAVTAGKLGISIYSSKEAIREACIKAGELVHELWEARYTKAFTRAIIENSQFGLIITDAHGNVQMFNKTAKKYTGVSSSQIRNRPITELFPNLSVLRLVKSDQHQMISQRLISGAMMRCTQEKIVLDNRTVGVLITIYPHSQKKKRSDMESRNYENNRIYRWDQLTALSDSMKRIVEKGRLQSKLEYPTAILGSNGTGRETIARCMHGASNRSNKPCITIDLATISAEDAARTLFGYEQNNSSVAGLLANANGGSVVLKNFLLAPERVQACIIHAVISQRIFRPSMDAPLSLDIVYYTLATLEEYVEFSPTAKSCLAVQEIILPQLSHRKEDIEQIFLHYLSNDINAPKRTQLSEQMIDLLQFYNWPGNLRELRTVCKRYSIACADIENPTPKNLYLILLQSIGRERVFEYISELYPAIKERSAKDKEGFRQGIQALKRYMKYSNEQIAEKLNVSRTTIWRIQQKTEADDNTD